jgi:uncharacterized membrane protein
MSALNIQVSWVNITNIVSRFHAWQSTLLFVVLLIIHIIFSWSTIFSWLLFIGDLFLIGHLTYRAYKDGQSLTLLLWYRLIKLTLSPAETIDRYELPIFGRLASSILDDE